MFRYRHLAIILCGLCLSFNVYATKRGVFLSGSFIGENIKATVAVRNSFNVVRVSQSVSASNQPIRLSFGYADLKDEKVGYRAYMAHVPSVKGVGVDANFTTLNGEVILKANKQGGVALGFGYGQGSYEETGTDKLNGDVTRLTMGYTAAEISGLYYGVFYSITNLKANGTLTTLNGVPITPVEASIDVDLTGIELEAGYIF